MIRFDEGRWTQTQPREAGRDTLCRGQGSASWAITERGGEGDGALYQPHLRMACGLSVGWLGCTSFTQGERATEAVDGRAVEMDLHHGDYEEPSAAAISICVVDAGDDPYADPTQVRHQTQRGIGGSPIGTNGAELSEAAEPSV